MSVSLTLSLDAMGGDRAPDMVLKGIRIAHERHPRVRFLMHGNEAALRPVVAKDKTLAEVCEIRHTDSVVSGDEKPSQAVRRGRDSSLWRSIQAVKDGDAAGVVSAGNTGAFMAMAKLALRTLPGIDRPAIAALMPTQRGDCVMLDLGANAECDADNLVQFAIMGEVFGRTVLGLDNPNIGLLNIGTEDQKGTDALRQASAILRDSALPIRFHGFVEGDDIGKGTVDVIVTDGFTGNVALKAIEGTSKLYTSFLRRAFESSILSRLGYLLARPALNKVRMRADPRRYNGAMFLGLNGIAVKSHGGTDPLGFANAVCVAIDLISNGFNDTIRGEFMKVQRASGLNSQDLERAANG
ncbi:phosphate acyltransferase PlsX [Roseospira marina]|uniref:Phosphate acyltransferase n=1 Tax=Roseospira marina TaxID=140057 RepID=A0A5M6IH72_9PROT|nr:phosphate acyltransferase PlsX [Roseospira marina]KAA5607522.1 phosphate acyltransferase PlsX [Roseospira marina]MBB4312293.1 glycerol-3-phosphate acyltransferase PlsX [Roseospira marina]MBB5085691.1 glycerol-3-phosphate acyltransferase PlsX [Roseospira marina]